MGSAHCPTEVTFDQSLEKILPGVKEIQSGHKILCLHCSAIGSAHRSLRQTFDQN